MNARAQLDELVGRLPRDVVESTVGCLALLDNLDELAEGEERAPFEAWFSVWSQRSRSAHLEHYDQLIVAARSMQFIAELQELLQARPEGLETDLPRLMTWWTHHVPAEALALPKLKRSQWISDADQSDIHLRVIKVPHGLDLAVFARIIQSWEPPALPEETLQRLRALGRKPLPPEGAAGGVGESESSSIESTPQRRLPASLGMGDGPQDLAERSEELLRGGFGG